MNVNPPLRPPFPFIRDTRWHFSIIKRRLIDGSVIALDSTPTLMGAVQRAVDFYDAGTREQEFIAVVDATLTPVLGFVRTSPHDRAVGFLLPWKDVPPDDQREIVDYLYRHNFVPLSDPG